MAGATDDDDDGEVVWTTNLPMMMTSGKVPPARRLSECARRGSRAGARSSGGPPERRRRDRDTHAAPRPSARAPLRAKRASRGVFGSFSEVGAPRAGDLFEPGTLGKFSRRRRRISRRRRLGPPSVRCATPGAHLPGIASHLRAFPSRSRWARRISASAAAAWRVASSRKRRPSTTAIWSPTR